MKNIFSIITPKITSIEWTPAFAWCTSALLVTILSGCANLPSFTEHSKDEIQESQQATQLALAAEKAFANGSLSPAEEKLPSVKLTEELLYKLLTSEIAFQRGNWQAAYVTISGLLSQA